MDLATSCYEFACGKSPNNMDHMMGLFNCYVREYSFVKQQQVGAFRMPFVNLLLFVTSFFIWILDIWAMPTYCNFILLADSHQNVQACWRRKVFVVGSL